MRIYMIGLLVAFLGLLAANRVQADGYCGLACISDIGYADGSGVIIEEEKMMPAAPLTVTPMKDGSRHFLSLPESCSSATLKSRLESIPGIRVRDISQGGFQWRMAFQCLGWRFFVYNPFGEFWFFAEDAACPEEILRCLSGRISTLPS